VCIALLLKYPVFWFWENFEFTFLWIILFFAFGWYVSTIWICSFPASIGMALIWIAFLFVPSMRKGLLHHFGGLDKD
jgi:hypothetical protein